MRGWGAHQHNAVVFKAPYAQYPFEALVACLLTRLISLCDTSVDTETRLLTPGDAGDMSDDVIVPGPDGCLISLCDMPFDTVTRLLTPGDAGDMSDDVIVPGPDGRLISSDERMLQVRQGQTGPDTSLEGQCCPLAREVSRCCPLVRAVAVSRGTLVALGPVL